MFLCYHHVRWPAMAFLRTERTVFGKGPHLSEVVMTRRCLVCHQAIGILNLLVKPSSLRLAFLSDTQLCRGSFCVDVSVDFSKVQACEGNGEICWWPCPFSDSLECASQKRRVPLHIQPERQISHALRVLSNSIIGAMGKLTGYLGHKANTNRFTPVHSPLTLN